MWELLVDMIEVLFGIRVVDPAGTSLDGDRGTCVCFGSLPLVRSVGASPTEASSRFQYSRFRRACPGSERTSGKLPTINHSGGSPLRVYPGGISDIEKSFMKDFLSEKLI